MNSFFKICLAAFVLISSNLAFAQNSVASVYRIGVILPLSPKEQPPCKDQPDKEKKPFKNRGLALKNALELFVEQFNATNSANNYKIELDIRDDKHDPDISRKIAEEMAQDSSLISVIGYYFPSAAQDAMEIFNFEEIPLISPNVSSPDFLNSDNEWNFSMNASDIVRGEFMAVYIKEVLKKDNVLLIYTTGKQGEALRNGFRKKAQKIGLKIHDTLGIKKGSSKLDTEWAKQNLPDVEETKDIGIIATMLREDKGTELLEQLDDHKLNVPIISADFIKAEKQYKKDVYITSGFAWEVANKKAYQFARNYQEKYLTVKKDDINYKLILCEMGCEIEEHSEEHDKENNEEKEHVKGKYKRKMQHEIPVAAAFAYDAAFLVTSALQQHIKNNKKSGNLDIKSIRNGIRKYLVDLEWNNAIEGVTGLLFFKGSHDEKNKQYVDTYLSKQLLEKSTENNDIKPKENHAPLRDIFVYKINEGQFKPAAIQLLQPREEYVFKQLDERLEKKFITIVDRKVYHIVDVIFVGMDIIRINDVNVKDMKWDVDLFVWFKWEEQERFCAKEIKKISVINPIKEQSSLVNQLISKKTKYQAFRKRLTLDAPYNVSSFPFDSQTLSLSFAHENRHYAHIMLVLDEQHLDNSPINDIKPAEWNYIKHDVFSNLHRYKSTFGYPNYRDGTNYKSSIYFSTINFEIRIKRILQPYLYTFFLPLFILLGITLVVLWVPIDQFTPRINASVSGLVGILVYHMSQKNTFPKVGYTMMADYYFLSAYIFIVTLIICIILIQVTVSQGKKEEAQIWNKRLAVLALIISSFIYLLMTFLSIIYADKVIPV